MKNKKLLLVGVATMGLVAAATAGVGTAAWYQVTANGSVSESVGDADITTVAPTGSVSVALPLTVSAVATYSSLELAHWYAAGDLTANNWYLSTSDPATYTKQQSANTASLMTAVHLNDQSKTLVHKAGAFNAGSYLWTDVTITITAPEEGATVDGFHYTQEEIASLLNGKTIDIDIARDTGSRAKFWGLGSSAVSAPTAAGATGISGIYGQPGNAAAVLSNLGSTGTVLHFGLYVEGDNSGTVDTAQAAPQGDFVVTVTQNDPNAH